MLQRLGNRSKRPPVLGESSLSRKDLRGPNKQTPIPILRFLGFFAVYRWNPTLESSLTIKTINEFLFDHKEADKIVFNRRSCLVCQFKVLKIGKRAKNQPRMVSQSLYKTNQQRNNQTNVQSAHLGAKFSVGILQLDFGKLESWIPSSYPVGR